MKDTDLQHEEQGLPPKREADEEDIEDLLTRTYALLETVLERRLPKVLHKDLLRLHTDISEVISWSRLH